uniref:RING-type E3 ubiquitin transferase n=1 Tax=Zea mays TaxID=4577 RepID=A0A804LGB1_MAIZE
MHYAAYYGHADCLRTILSAAAKSAPVSKSWGFARFVNVRDDTGATPLHLAARQGWRRCVHVLLENGAIVSASSGAFGFSGSTPLHLAARDGNLDCVRQLLSWGADRLQRDSVGRIPYEVAAKRGHVACAALLNPSSAEPLVWPSALKFISELEPDAKSLLEAALMEANRERERRTLKGAKNALPSPSHPDDGAHGTAIAETTAVVPVQASDAEVCSICFEQACSIEVRECGHQMCAACTLALCCHAKPNPATQSQPLPTCPFCRGGIARLVVATRTRAGDDEERGKLESPRHCQSRRSMSLSGDTPTRAAPAPSWAASPPPSARWATGEQRAASRSTTTSRSKIIVSFHASIHA